MPGHSPIWSRVASKCSLKLTFSFFSDLFVFAWFNDRLGSVPDFDTIYQPVCCLGLPTWALGRCDDATGRALPGPFCFCQTGATAGSRATPQFCNKPDLITGRCLSKELFFGILVIRLRAFASGQEAFEDILCGYNL